MFERFTEKARRVVVLAQDEARSLGHTQIANEHFVLGLLRVEPPLAERVLASLETTLDDVRAQVGRLIEPWHGILPAQIPFTPRAKRLMELSLREALAAGDGYIGPEHLLLALLEHEQVVAVHALDSVEITFEELRALVARFFERGEGGALGTRGDPAIARIPFAPKVKRALQSAQAEARGLEHGYVGTEHILLGLLRDERGLAFRVLASLGITYEDVLVQVARIAGQPGEVPSGPLPVTPRVKEVFRDSQAQARSLGHDYVGPEHVLLGLVGRGEGVAARILFDAKAEVGDIRAEIARLRPA